MKWYWPKLTSLKEAEEAAHAGAGVCFLIAAFRASVAGACLWLGKPVLGMDTWASADAIIFAIAGWSPMPDTQSNQNRHQLPINL